MTATVDAGAAEAVSLATIELDARKLIAYPAGGRYAIGADALDEDAINRALEVTGHPPDAGVSVVVPDLESARHVAHVTPAARRIAHLLPGPVTLLLPAAAHAPDVLHGARGAVAVRVPPEPFARALAAHFGPVLAPRAARAGAAAPRRVADAMAAVGAGALALAVDDGVFADVPAATLVDATGAEPRVLREGALPSDALDAGPA